MTVKKICSKDIGFLYERKNINKIEKISNEYLSKEKKKFSIPLNKDNPTNIG